MKLKMNLLNKQEFYRKLNRQLGIVPIKNAQRACFKAANVVKNEADQERIARLTQWSGRDEVQSKEKPANLCGWRASSDRYGLFSQQHYYRGADGRASRDGHCAVSGTLLRIP